MSVSEEALDVYYIVESEKHFDQTVSDLEVALENFEVRNSIEVAKK